MALCHSRKRRMVVGHPPSAEEHDTEHGHEAEKPGSSLRLPFFDRLLGPGCTGIDVSWRHRSLRPWTIQTGRLFLFFSSFFFLFSLFFTSFLYDTPFTALVSLPRRVFTNDENARRRSERQLAGEMHANPGLAYIDDVPPRRILCLKSTTEGRRACCNATYGGTPQPAHEVFERPAPRSAQGKQRCVPRRRQKKTKKTCRGGL